MSAATGRTLCVQPAVLAHVLWPVLSMVPVGPLPERIVVGEPVTIRLRLLGVVPAWSHTLTAVRLDDLEVETRESGGPVRAWNHILTFAPISATTCRYTDQVEIDAGPATPPLAAGARVLYRYRQAGWRRLARLFS